MGKPGSTIKQRVATVSLQRGALVATERIRGGALQAIRARVLRRDKHLCRSCLAVDRVTIAVEVDHIVPLHAGGSECDDNRQSLCVDCHAAKSAAEELVRRKG
jgi:5-methylcytosine-specific restriction protein A